jgi:hypothetical protein
LRPSSSFFTSQLIWINTVQLADMIADRFPIHGPDNDWYNKVHHNAQM